MRGQQKITRQVLHRSGDLSGDALADHFVHILPGQSGRQKDPQQILSHHIHALPPVLMKGIRTDPVMLLRTERFGAEHLSRFK